VRPLALPFVVTTTLAGGCARSPEPDAALGPMAEPVPSVTAAPLGPIPAPSARPLSTPEPVPPSAAPTASASGVSARAPFSLGARVEVTPPAGVYGPGTRMFAALGRGARCVVTFSVECPGLCNPPGPRYVDCLDPEWELEAVDAKDYSAPSELYKRVDRKGGRCVASYMVRCAPPAKCNPPAPREVPCPPDRR
jgi:hypothetical protein